MSSSPASPNALTQKLWAQHIPLVITHAERPSQPFVISVPRFSYLALLLPRLGAFFQAPCSSFHHENLLLRNLPLGLLADLYQPVLPWQLQVRDGVGWDIADTFLNCVKEADFVRHGNANQIMKMSKEHTTALWSAVKDNDLLAFGRVNQILLNAPVALRHVPIRVYVPTMTNAQRAAALAAAPADSAPATPTLGTLTLRDASSSPSAAAAAAAAATTSATNPAKAAAAEPDSASRGDLPPAAAGTFKVVQTLVQPMGADRRTPQTLGQALKAMLPELFPSTRDPIYGEAVMHGAPVPFSAPVAELMREAAYPDGWLCLVVHLF